MVISSISTPSKFRAFFDIFEKQNTDPLPEHRPYDYPIDLLDGVYPPFGPIYGLSKLELDVLRAYINKKLAKSFILH